jgi:hypothetical protein
LNKGDDKSKKTATIAVPVVVGVAGLAGVIVSFFFFGYNYTSSLHAFDNL